MKKWISDHMMNMHEHLSCRKQELSKKPLHFHNTAEGFKTFKIGRVNIMKANGLEKIIVGMEPHHILSLQLHIVKIME